MFRYHIIRILQITTAILLAGRSWQHFFWDVPYEYLFTEKYGFTEWFNDQFTAIMGWFYLIGVIFCFALDNRNSKWAYVFVVYAASLLLLSQMFRAANNCEIPTLFLYSSQIATPLIYYQLQFTKIPIGRIMGTLKLSLTLTLTAYAWYAFGFYYGHKTAWLQGLNYAFNLERNTAQYLLYSLGVVEVLLILVLWVKPIQKLAFAGILLWGFLLMMVSTALFFLEHPHWQSGLRSAWELLCLLPNAGLSFAIWSYVNWKKKADNF